MPKMVAAGFLLQIQRMAVGDFGPIYTETQLGRFPVEPFNTFSNLIFFFIIIYFSIRTRLNFRRHRLIVSTLPLLFVGFVGGTIYHATRSDRIWLILDYMPIMILVTSASIYFWSRVLGGIVRALILGLLIFLTIRFSFSSALPIGLKITLAYTSLAVSILTPAIIYTLRSDWRGFSRLMTCAALFGVALVFRYIDQFSAEYFPVGTHFLWHLFGGGSVFALMLFIFDDDCLCNQNSSLAQYQ